MANLMINKVCNLNCPYCFASDYVNTSSDQMDEKTFHTALEFALSGGDNSVGIMGGEPTLHPQLKRFLEILAMDKRVQRATLMTNGTNLAPFIDILLSDPKFIVLVNVNSYDDIGQIAYDRMVKNIAAICADPSNHKHITLGVNIYRPDFTGDYIIPLLRDFGLHEVRMSLVVPANRCKTELNALDYFCSMKKCLLDFCMGVLPLKVLPFFDCNTMPDCLWTDGERETLKTVAALAGINLHNQWHRERCFPVVDILPDLTALRCFGLGEKTALHIEDFPDIDALRGFYWRTIDCYSCNTSSAPECVTCDQRRNGQCAGGCLNFKIDQIRELNAYADKKMAEGFAGSK